MSFITFYSCDKELFEDFIVINNLPTSITVGFETVNGDNNDIQIQPNSEMIVRQARGFGNSVSILEINRWFTAFEVVKDDTVKSSVDYLLDKYWEYEEVSDTYAEYRLVVDETHFK